VTYAAPPHPGPDSVNVTAEGMWRYADALPLDGRDAVSLGEGRTPLLRCERLGQMVGLPRLMVKVESQNPTGSVKDRMASMGISWAVASGRPGVAASSTGNAGIAAAAYCARASLPCIVFATASTPRMILQTMAALGAMVVTTTTLEERWQLNRAVVDEWGWLPLSNAADPPAGSHPVAIEGYKTIAYEIAEALGWTAPDAVIAPVAYGDALWGMCRGFQEMRDGGVLTTVPKLIAAEAYPTLSTALASGSEAPVRVAGSGSRARSIATNIGTYQALEAIRRSGGTAIQVPDEEAIRVQRALGRDAGVLVELSSAMPLAAAQALARARVLGPDQLVVILATATGTREVEEAFPRTAPPAAGRSVESLAAVLERAYGFRM
jgi:threonine synthase